jgi:hypothetical protein
LDFGPVQHAFEFSTEMKEGVREAKLSRATPAFRYGIWINLTNKGGRMRSIPYPDLEMTVDIPKPIAVQLVAVRILHFVRFWGRFRTLGVDPIRGNACDVL